MNDAIETSVKPEIQLFPEQQEAKDIFLEWFEALPQKDTEDFEQMVGGGYEQIFRIYGYAGTGKTISTKSIVKEVKGLIVFAAYTGKAALVMNRSGLPAHTVHSVIYRPVLPDKKLAQEIREDIDKAKYDGLDKDKMKKLHSELVDASTMYFELNDESILKDAVLLVLDECSMINDEMKSDILTFNVPLLVLGDPGQLPPITGTGALTQAEPDILLEKIHRQALDNPIIKLSMDARIGRPIRCGDYGDSRKIKLADLKVEDFTNADQILTGKNVTRKKINKKMREVLGFNTDIYPIVGDKLICLRNNRKIGLFNGLLCTVLRKVDEFDTSIEYELKSEDDRNIICRILRAHFDEYKTPGTVKSLKWWDFQEAEEFDFGYAITVHKSQGSQWDNILLYDDGMLQWRGKEIERRRWLYTAITRAAETLTIVER